jgi:hypothetical protein
MRDGTKEDCGVEGLEVVVDWGADRDKDDKIALELSPSLLVTPITTTTTSKTTTVMTPLPPPIPVKRRSSSSSTLTPPLTH